MGDRYLTELADVLRDTGALTVVEVEGWEYRARSSGGYPGLPLAVFWHHTASDTTAENDVGYICYGCPDAPVSNLYLARDGAVWVCAGGATNTNGKGGPLDMSRGTIPIDQANSNVIGIEAANNGLGQPWPAVQVDAYFTVNNALADAYGLAPSDLATHNGWCEPSCPGRKIEPATAAAVQGPWRPGPVNGSGTWSQTDVRAEAARRATPPPPQGDDDMTDDQARQLLELHQAMCTPQPGFTDPAGAPLNAAWAALWGEYLIAGDIYRMLVDIQARVGALEEQP